MGTLTFYLPGDDDRTKEIRQQLNTIAAGLGYKAKAGPSQSGGSAAMIAAIAGGELKVTKTFVVQIPTVGWDQDDQSVLVEQRIDDDTFLSVDIIEERTSRSIRGWSSAAAGFGHTDEIQPMPVKDREPVTYAVRHAVVVRYDDNTEVRNVSARAIELVA